MRKQTIEEWKAEGNAMYGADPKKWKFKCPSCGHIQTGEDFEKIEKVESWQKVYKECIGRYVEGEVCNWAAYGLFRTLGKGRIVGDNNTEIFGFAEELQ